MQNVPMFLFHWQSETKILIWFMFHTPSFHSQLAHMTRKGGKKYIKLGHLQINEQCPVMKLYPSIGRSAKRFHLIIAPKRCFTTVLVFLFYFYEGIIFFLPFSAFPASVYILFTAFSPEFSWKCSVFPPQEFYDSLREC